MPGHDHRVIEEDDHSVSDKNNNSDSDYDVNDINYDNRDNNDVGNDNDNRDENDDDNDGNALDPSVPLRSSPSRPQRAWTEEVGRLERLFDHVKNIFLKTHPVVGRRSKDCEPQ